MMDRATSVPPIDQSVFATPLVSLRRLDRDLPGRVFLKLENRNPLGSVKDRIGRAIIDAAERDGALRPGGTIIEATSGNTGIALAWVGAARGYRVVLTMPESMSIERRRLLRALGADLELTPSAMGMRGALDRAQTLAATIPGAVEARQFANPANPAAHEAATGPEIWQQSGENVDAFVAGVGTGGTITGVGRFLRKMRPDVALCAVEPAESQVLAGKAPAAHAIQGIGAGFVPPVLDRSLLSQIVPVRASDAAAMARRLAREEGIFGGISAGANLHAALSLARMPAWADKTIVTVICDSGERYMSTALFEEE
jgi:cysteine synthase A